MTTVSEPRIDTRPERPYLGIRVQTPMIGMFTVIERLRKEMMAWFDARQIVPAGPSFVRFHVIDMAGEMDIAVGIPVPEPLAGDERVRADVLPAGRYASLVFIGHGLTGNKALLRFGQENGLVWDKWDDPRGDAFRARCETLLTDPRTEPRKKQWEVEVSIKIRDEPV